jgi:DNA-binding NtrC family response regulator
MKISAYFRVIWLIGLILLFAEPAFATQTRSAAEGLYAYQHNYIGLLLKDHNGNVAQASKQCGLGKQALQQIMRHYQIKADDYRN